MSPQRHALTPEVAANLPGRGRRGLLYPDAA
jgi:hypothetical protein